MELPTKGDVRDPSFRKWLASHRVIVFLDGKRIDRAIAYDTERGWLLRYKTDETGQLVLNDKKDEVLTEELTGQVMVDLG